MPCPSDLAAAPSAQPAAPETAVLAFACAPTWIEADAAPATGRTALPRFALVAYTGGPMRLGGWRHPVIVDLTGLRLPSQHRPIRLGHDAALGVGHTDRIAVEDGRLIASGVVSRDTAAAREVVASSRNGFPWQASIGAAVEEHEFVREGQTVHVNGALHSGPVNVVRRSTLGEISFVDLGADGNTSALVAIARSTPPSASAPADPSAPSAAPAAGDARVTTPAAPVSATELTTASAPLSTPAVVAAATATAPTAPVLPTVAELRAAAVAETERIAAVRRCCDGHAAIEAQAIRDGWTAHRAELEVLRADRPQAPAIHVHDRAPTPAVLEAACLLSGGLPGAERVCEAPALDAAQRRFRGGISLQELLLEAAWANGYTGRFFRDNRSVLRAAFGVDVRASGGLSPIDLGGILSNVANKFLLAGFLSVERTWRAISAVRPVTDFKKVTSYRLIGGNRYQTVPPGGTIQHGNLGELAYENQADTHALLLSIDRRDLINDDLGAISQVPTDLGRSAALTVNEKFWATFLANAAFFTPERGNHLTGVASALGIDGLTAAEVAFAEQTDPKKNPLGIQPAVLLVPPALAALARALFTSTELRQTIAGQVFPTANPHQGRFRVESSAYLSSPGVAGSSRSAWYLLANPADLPVIETVFLYGNESPTIDSTEADFSTLGIQMRGVHDFGIALQEHRGGVKADGPAAAPSPSP